MTVAGSILQSIAIIGTVAAGGTPPVAVAVSCLVVAAAAYAAVHLRRRHIRPRWRVGVTVALVGAVTLLSGVMYLVPDATTAPERRAATLRLADGTALAVRRHESKDSVNPPVVVIHGGPGVPLTSTEEAAIAAMIPDRTVVFYDQIGTGQSSRLDKPSRYTMSRMQDDLGQVIRSLGRPHVTLLGFSWGAPVATIYAAHHPDTVDGLILVSPGAFPAKDRPIRPSQPQSRLSHSDLARLYLQALMPRNLFMYTLTTVNVDAAHWFGSDAEMDARFVSLYVRTGKGLTCDSRRPVEVPDGLGYYASQNPQVNPDANILTPQDVQRIRHEPVLVVRGHCDYIPRSEAATYSHHLENTTLVDVPDAGHSVVVEQSGTVSRLVRAFLNGPVGPAG